MSLLRRALPSLERRGADPRAPWGDSTPPSNGMLGSPVAGTYVNESAALQVAAVYGSVSVIADAVSTLPIDLMSSPHRRSGTTLTPSPLITEPYAEISLEDWWTQYVASMALRGNFFGQIIARDPQLYPTQVKPIHPDHVQVRRMPDGTVEYRFNGKPVRTDDVFHVRNLSVPESLVGLNPIEYLRNILGLARASDMYGAAFFQNSAYPGGYITVEDELDPDETAAMAKEWLQMHQGIGHAALPAVLTGGAEFKPITITPEDAQFLESRQYGASVISGQIFRVPPHMIGIVDRTTSWGTGIEQQEMGFVRNTLLAYLIKGERALTRLHPPGQFVKFDLTERLRGDKLQRFTAYNLGRLGGWLNADEIRAEEDLAPIPDGEGQEYLVPINSELLSQAIEAAKQQIVAQQQPPPQGGGDDPGQTGGKSG
jgi:HK97 family phage portal protein